MSNNFQTSLGRSDDINVFKVACSEGSTDFDTGISARDGSFLEQRRSGFTEVGAKVAWVVTRTCDEVITILVVVCTAVKDIHPKVNLGDVSAVSGSTRDVDDRVGHASTLAAVHVVGVGVVKTNTVVVGVSTACIAWWVTNVSGLTWSS